MFYIIISWCVCTFVAVAIATNSIGEDFQGYVSESSIADSLQKPNTALDLGALLDAGEGAMVVLVSGDTRLLAHRAVLSARSPVFQRLLQDTSTGEVATPDIEGPVLRQLLGYLYTLQAPQLPGMALRLLAAADRYSLPALKAACEQQVAAQLSVQTAAATAVLAIRHSSDSLRQAAIAYIRAHIFEVMGTRGWTNMMKSQTEVMSNVIQLLFRSPAETSSSAPVMSGASPYTTTRSHNDLSGHSEHQTPAIATPTVPAQTITPTVDDYISLLRSLSEDEKTRRLMEAAEHGAVAELEALLAAWADVGARDEDMKTALHWAAEEGHVVAARRLLAAGAAVDARDDDGWTPLHYAARQGHAAVVRLLLANKADLGARKNDGWTPLHLAAANGNREATAALLEAGADRWERNNDGVTPLDLARSENYQQVVQLLQQT